MILRFIVIKRSLTERSARDAVSAPIVTYLGIDNIGIITSHPE